MRWLLTGATGFIGRSVVAELRERGEAVFGVSRGGVGHDSDVSWLPGNWLEPDWSVPEGFEADALVHLAGPSAWELLGQPEVYESVMSAAKRAHGVAVQAKVQRLVMVSSAAALGGEKRGQAIDLNQTDWPYACGKLDAEAWLREACQASDIALSVVYPAEVYGPEDVAEVTCGTLKQWIAERWVLITDGGTHVAHVDDVAAAIVKAADEPVIWFAGGEYLEFATMARMTRSIAGRNDRVMKIPDWSADFAVWLPRQTGMDWVGHPDVAVQYGQVHWRKPAEVATAPVRFRGAQDTLLETVEWMTP